MLTLGGLTVLMGTGTCTWEAEYAPGYLKQ